MHDHHLESSAGRTIILLEKYDIEDAYLLGKYSYTHVQKKLESHLHDQMIEICYCDKGQQVYEVEGREYQVKGGEVFVTFPNELHSTDNHPEEKGVLYWLQVRIPVNERFLGYRGDDAHFFVNQLLTLPLRQFKGSGDMKKTLDEILYRLEEPRKPINKLIVPHLITHFLLSVVKCAYSDSGKLNCEDKINLIKNYISENLFNDISIKDIARKFNISTSHFKSWFKKETGIPPADFVLRMKIEEAKMLMLQHKHLSITEIAYQFNFSTSQYFATVFKRYEGMSPVEYKKKITKEYHGNSI
jgi:AraC-like DNA-binding protein